MLTTALLRARLEALFLTQSGVAAHWTPTIKLALLNEAREDVYREMVQAFQTKFFVQMDTSVVPVSAQINLSGLSKPYYSVIAFQKQSGTTWIDIPIVPQHEAWRYSQSGGLERWFDMGTKLVANDDGVTGTYRIAYHYQLSPLVNDGDLSEIPDGYDEMIPYRAAYIGSIQAKEKEDASMFGQEYNARIQRMKDTAQRRNLVRFAVKDVEGYGASEMIGLL